MIDTVLNFLTTYAPIAVTALVALSTAVDAARAFLAGEFSESDDFAPATEKKILGVLGTIGSILRKIVSGASLIRGRR